MRFLLTFVLVLAADQLSKFTVKSMLALGESVPVIEPVFYLTYVRNQGAAFSLLPGKSWLFIAVSLIVIAGIFFYVLRQRPSGALAVILALIAGGALGNMIDRIIFGYVIDFFDFRVWPVFNLADTAIVAGAFLFIIMVLRSEKETPA